MDNYRYCAEFMAARAKSPDFCVLDYGCGSGRIVAMLRARGIEAFGCDTYRQGFPENLSPEALGVHVKHMTEETIPFPAESFDMVVTNQVLEHVADLEAVLGEIHRVLKPGGTALCLFPDKGVWREGHCGIPWLHWFPKGSRFRIWYAIAFRSLGFGHHKGTRSLREWGEYWCAWLDERTHYRSYPEISRAFAASRFGTLRHMEDAWLRTRLGRLHPAGSLIPAPVSRWVVRKTAGLVFLTDKTAGMT